MQQPVTIRVTPPCPFSTPVCLESRPLSTELRTGPGSSESESVPAASAATAPLLPPPLLPATAKATRFFPAAGRGPSDTDDSEELASRPALTPPDPPPPAFPAAAIPAGARPAGDRCWPSSEEDVSSESPPPPPPPPATGVIRPPAGGRAAGCVSESLVVEELAGAAAAAAAEAAVRLTCCVCERAFREHTGSGATSDNSALQRRRARLACKYRVG